jgi:hypothetical protein
MHADSLDDPSPLDIVWEGQPDRRDEAANQFDTSPPSVGAGMRWDPTETLELTPDTAPGVASGPGLAGGPAGQVSLAELKRRARARRTDDRYPDEISEQLEAAREAIADGVDPAALEPIDAT